MMYENNIIGVMQGRLLSKYKGRYQAHPVGYWEDEFKVANKVGVGAIEFILDFNEVEKNPLMYEGGIDEIHKVVEETGVVVQTICADYFMEAPLHTDNIGVVKRSSLIMEKLISASSHLGVTDIVLPCVDASSLSGKPATDRLLYNLSPLLDSASRHNINISLESDLSPHELAMLLDTFNSKSIKVNYDIGNSAALGYDPVEELDAYGDHISDIHIKDRILGGGPVVLGTGDADFSTFFTKLSEYNYEGPFIMQAYRDDEGVEIFTEQLSWIKQFLV